MCCALRVACVRVRRATGTIAVAIALFAAGVTTADAPDLLAKGALLYARSECAGCHEHGEARPLAGLSLRYDRPRLTELLRNPPPPMPRFELSDDELRDFAAYLLAAFP